MAIRTLRCAVLLPTLLLWIGCCVLAFVPPKEERVFRGWLLLGSPSLSLDRPQFVPPSGTAALIRNPNTNALSISVSPPRDESLLTSLQRSFTLILSFHSSVPIAGTVESLVVPLLSSRHFILQSTSLSLDGKIVTVA